MKRFGAVIVFRRHVSEAEAAQALHQLTTLIETGPGTPVPGSPGNFNPPSGSDRLEEFDDRYGGPVWYVP